MFLPLHWWLFLTIRFSFWQRHLKNYFLLSLQVAVLVAFTKHSCFKDNIITQTLAVHFHKG